MGPLSLLRGLFGWVWRRGDWAGFAGAGDVRPGLDGADQRVRDEQRRRVDGVDGVDEHRRRGRLERGVVVVDDDDDRG